jgi:hypothetical protein
MKNETHEYSQSKKAWATPQLVIHGTIEEITTQSLPPKAFGSSDGAFWQGQPVSWATS